MAERWGDRPGIAAEAVTVFALVAALTHVVGIGEAEVANLVRVSARRQDEIRVVAATTL